MKMLGKTLDKPLKMHYDICTLWDVEMFFSVTEELHPYNFVGV